MSLRFKMAATCFATALLSVGATAAASPSDAASVYQIVNWQSSLCLGSTSSNQSEIGTCTSTTSQLWVERTHITLSGVTYYQWQNEDGNCLGLAGGTGPQLVVGACTSTSDHSQFWAGDIANSSFMSATEIVNGHTGDCVGTKGSGTSSGTLVVEGGCTTTFDGTRAWY